MTEISPGRPPPGRRRLRHRRPVLSFLAVVLLFVLPAAALAWTGAANPRLRQVGQGGPATSVDPAGSSVVSRATYTVEVTNDAALPVDVDGAEPVTRGLDDVEVHLSLGPPHEEEGEPRVGGEVTLGAGDHLTVEVKGVATCARPSVEEVHLEVRTRLGLERTVVVGGWEPDGPDCD